MLGDWWGIRADVWGIRVIQLQGSLPEADRFEAGLN